VTTSSVPTVSVTMPKLGESVVEGTVVRWLKREGEQVGKYEPLAEVITDKVNSEIPSPADGTVARLLVAEGQTVPVGTEIAVISASGSASGGGAAPVADSLSPAAGEDAEAAPRDYASTQDGDDGRRRTSPLVRRLARDYRVDLSQVPGTGAEGRVRKEDIFAYIEQRQSAATAGSDTATPSQPVTPPASVTGMPEPAAAPAPTGPAAGDDEEVLPLTPIRRAIAEHMVRSVHTSPHTWTFVETDVSGLVKWRQQEREAFRRREGFDLTYVPFVCKAVVETLREHPVLNSTWRDGEGGGQVVLKKRVNLGVAVALEDNLVVPVIKDADRLNVAGLAHALHELVTRARAGRLRPEDVQGGTFTLNNTGALGSILSQPIINQPQAAILTMEAIVKRVVVTDDDAIAVRPMMNVCISFDHRICDGLQVGRFMQSLKRRIESLQPGGTLY
jgi:2-oxoisovalerate dehydrogenase E2 component (dihydrolipoyl transacylase)